MTNHTAEDVYATGIRLWNAWTEMFNHRPELARTIVADRFVLHLVTPNPRNQLAVDNPAEVER
jgi:hypothetical protein